MENLGVGFRISRSDVDPGRKGPCVVAVMDKFTRSTESCGGKAMARPLSQEESASTLALTGFYCFSGHITWGVALIYYAQVHCRLLPFTENKGKNATNYLKRRMLQLKGESG